MTDDNITLQDLFNKLVLLETKLDGTKQSLDAITAEFSQNKTKIEELEKENTNLKKKLNQIEQNEKKNNVIVYGLPNQNTVNQNLSELEALIGVTFEKRELNGAYFIGQNQNKLMKIEFISNFKKQEVLNNCYKLKGKNIYINHDWTKEEMMINKFLRGVVKEAKDNNLNASIKKNRLVVVNGKTYTYEQLKNSTEKIYITENKEEGGQETENSECEYVEASDEENIEKNKEGNKQYIKSTTGTIKKLPKKASRRKRVI